MKIARLILGFSLFTLLSSVAFERGLFVLYLNECGYDTLQIAALQVSLFVANIISEVPTGLYADRFGRRSSLIMGALLTALSVIGQYLSASHMPLMLFFFILHGVAFAFVSGSGQALLYEHLQKSGRGDLYLRLSTWSRFAGSLALGLSMVMGAYLHRNSWAAVYVASSLVIVSSLLPLLLVSEIKTPPTQGNTIAQALRLLRQSRQLLPMIVPFSLMHAAMTPYFIYSQKLFSSFSLRPGRVSSIIALSEILGAFLAFSMVYFRNQWKLERSAPLFLLAFAACLLANAFANLQIAIAAFLIAASIVLFLQSLSVEYVQQRIQDDSVRASTLSMMTFVDSIAISLSYFAYGFLLKFLPATTAVAITAVLPLAAVALLLRGRKEVYVGLAAPQS